MSASTIPTRKEVQGIPPTVAPTWAAQLAKKNRHMKTYENAIWDAINALSDTSRNDIGPTSASPEYQRLALRKAMMRLFRLLGKEVAL